MDRQTFNDHLEQWVKDTAHLSAVEDMQDHPSYEALKDAGEDILPFVFEVIEDRVVSVGLFTLLADITGAQPIEKDHRGHVPSMREDWLEWGRKNGYVDGS